MSNPAGHGLAREARVRRHHGRATGGGSGSSILRTVLTALLAAGCGGSPTQDQGPVDQGAVDQSIECTGPDSDGDGVLDSCDLCPNFDDSTDADGDGAPDECDCAPSDPSIFPGAEEICDGVDNDCSEVVDDAAVACPIVCPDGFLDWDRDGVDCEVEGEVLYVVGGVVGGSGLSWDSPIGTPDVALEVTVGGGAPRYQIWIQSGVYHPRFRQDPSEDVTRTLVLRHNVQLIGGFRGTERSVVTASGSSPTVLDGEDQVNTVVRLSSGTAELVNLVVRRGGAPFDTSIIKGGGILVESGATLLLDRVTIRESYAAQGAGVAVLNATVRARHLTIAENRGEAGVAIYQDGENAVFECDQCAVARNDGVSTGAAGLFANGTVVFRNSIFVRNRASVSCLGCGTGGLEVLGAAVELEHCTLVGMQGHRGDPDDPTVYGSAVDVSAGSVVLRNSLVFGNEDAGLSNGVTLLGTAVEGTESECNPGFLGVTNVEQLRLPSTSNCVDTGDPSVDVGPVDYFGNPRVTGDAPDVGASEAP